MIRHARSKRAFTARAGLSVLSHLKQGSQITIGILSMLGAAALAVLLGWLAIQFTTEIVGAFEVIADIVGWILLPLRV